jgi:hypothetical protein
MMSNALILLIFIGGSIGLLTLHAESEIEIVICKGSEAPFLFIGEKRDYKYLQNQGILTELTLCQTKKMTLDTWNQTRNALNRSFLNTREK